MSKTITEFEQKTYDFIKEQNGIQVSSLPKMMWGAIPNLKHVGLVETYKKSTNPWASKKHTFVKTIETTNKK